MAKMRDMDVRAKSVEIAMEAVKNGTFMDKAEPAGQNTLAYPVELDIKGNGETTEVWVTLNATCKMWKEYNARGVMHPPYNPFEVEEEWQATLGDRKKRAEEVAEKKAKKIAKQQKAREKAKGE